MSDIKVRNLNSFGFPGGFNITNNEPIDSRTKVIDITHIYEVKNWEGVKPYTGLIVSDDYGNSYMCINSSQDIDPKTNKPIFCSESSWIPFGKLSDQYSPEISYSKLIGLSAYGAYTMYTELVNARNNADDKIIASYTSADSKIIASYTAADTAIINSYKAADTAIINSYKAADSAIIDSYIDADSKIIAAYTAADSAIIKSYEAADKAIIDSYTDADSKIIAAYTAADKAIIDSYTDADSKIIAAYTAADAAIIGKNTDADTALTIYGVRKYAVTNCTNLQNTINNKLSWCAVTGHKSSTTTKSPV